METKNAFDYLESSFNKIFCKDGFNTIRSSLIVGLISVGLSTIIFSSFSYFVYKSTMDIFNLANYFYILFTFVLLLGIGLLESSYYAIVLPRKIQNRIFGTTFNQDYLDWKQYFGRYFLYITYFSTILLLLLLSLIIGGIFAYYIVDFGVVFYIFIALWIYVYVSYRLVITWYCILFENGTTWELFLKGWYLLGGKVYSTFKKVFIFSFIVGLAASISTYLAELVIPDFSSLLAEFVDKVNSLKGTQPTFEEILPLIKDILDSILVPGVYTLIIFAFFNKIGFTLQNAMIHSFLAEYYFNNNGEKNNSEKS